MAGPLRRGGLRMSRISGPATRQQQRHQPRLHDQLGRERPAILLGAERRRRGQSRRHLAHVDGQLQRRRRHPAVGRRGRDSTLCEVMPMRSVVAVALVLLLAAPAGAASPGATLTWTDTGTTATSYGVERLTGACATTGAWQAIAVVAAPTKTYLDSSVTFNTSYCYRVQSINNAGVSGYSNLAPFAPPGTPTNLNVK